LLEQLSKVWLPGKRFELLYRGSRDGMTPAAFHEKCDGKGATLVLVAGQSEGQPVCVFGGYAGKSWERGPEKGMPRDIDYDDGFAFVLAAASPSLTDGSKVIKIPSDDDSHPFRFTLRCRADYGPLFYSSAVQFALVNSSCSRLAPFDDQSFSTLLSTTTSRGFGLSDNVAVTAVSDFKPIDVEVWSVC
jgi:hypothetical protein